MLNKKKIKIGVLPGDGIGQEVLEVALPVFELLHLPMSLHQGDFGWKYWCEEGTPIPERTWNLIHHADVLLVGAATSKPPKEALRELNPKLQGSACTYISPLILLRQNLDLFANVRPCFTVKQEKKFNFCIIRENTEGLYAGLDYYPPPASLYQLTQAASRWQGLSPAEMSVCLRVQTTPSLARIFQFAFEYAKRNAFQQVTLAEKLNVFRQSGVHTRQQFEEVAQRFPEINAEIMNVDAVALKLVQKPEYFGVIVAENMFGDILSDVGAGLMGGLGFAPSANLGHHKAYFEPVHGSGPRLQPNQANPSAMFLSIALLLEHFLFFREAKIIRDAVFAVVNAEKQLTYDLGGQATTQAMAKAILDGCQELHEQKS